MNVLGLLRHGPTSWNRDKRIQGVRDIPLDRDAFDPAPWRELLLAHGPWDRIVTSPLSRAYETARLLFPDRSVQRMAELREQDWGTWTGRNITELRRDLPGCIEAQEHRGWDFTPPGGESRRDVLARALGVIDDLTRDRDDQRVLLVTHLGVIKILLNHLRGGPFLPGNSVRVAKRALHLLRQDDSGLSILQTNMKNP